MHIFELDATMEDTEVLGMAFHGQQMTVARAFGYRTWWREADLTRPTATTAASSNSSGSRRPPDLWLFKAPHHKFHLVGSRRRLSRHPFRHDAPRPRARSVPSYASIVSSILPPRPRRSATCTALGREV